MLRMRERTSGDVVIVEISGRIAAGAAETEIGHKVRSVLFRGYRKVLLNLGKAISSDASGVSAFLGALIDAHAVGAELRLVHVTRRMKDLCIIAALHRYFSVFDSEDEGVASFGAEPVQLPDRDSSSWLEPAA
jgi:anti-anti-sigma factor